MQKDIGKEPTEAELAEATSMTVVQVRRCLQVGRAARNKLIKVSKFFSSLLVNRQLLFGTVNKKHWQIMLICCSTISALFYL